MTSLTGPRSSPQVRPRWPEVARQVVFAGVVFAAGLSGVLLLGFPRSTPSTFAWGLQPEPLAALVGGFYLASALTFAFAYRQPWPRVRGLGFGVLALTIPTFLVTLLHLDVFDFSRVLAVLWVVLFLVTPILMTGIILRHPAGPVAEDTPLPAWLRALLAGFALLGLVGAIGLWVDPVGFGAFFPFELPPLGGRFVGCWSFFLAVLAAYPAARNRLAEAPVTLVALATFALGALLGAARTLDGMQSPGGTAYLGVLALLSVVTIGMWAGSRSRGTAGRPTAAPA